jgi:hypothetical protein
MEDEGAASGEPKHDGLSGELQAKITSVMADLTEPITSEWVSDLKNSDVVPLLLGPTVWGTIQWRKSLGRPWGKSLGDVFWIEHTGTQVVLVGTPPGSAHEETAIVPLPEPSKWDGPEDDDYFRVSFMTYTGPGYNTIEPKWIFPLYWETETESFEVLGLDGSFREISPPAQGWNGDDVVLDPFEIR